jgi:hypothetical protein
MPMPSGSPMMINELRRAPAGGTIPMAISSARLAQGQGAHRPGGRQPAERPSTGTVSRPEDVTHQVDTPRSCQRQPRHPSRPM